MPEFPRKPWLSYEEAKAIQELKKHYEKNLPDHGQPFYIRISSHAFKKNEILECPGNIKVKVIKTYPFNWWRRFLFTLGLPYKTFDMIKVREEYEETSED